LINTLNPNNMGHIKEPKGIDFVINSGSLSKKQEEDISRYIREYKSKPKKSLNKKSTHKANPTA
jgi:hypothetical protein